jgi:hypothetical protein
MSDPISFWLSQANDRYAPPDSKPSLQQWDNYQIHDLYCDDVLYQPLVVGSKTISPPADAKRNNFLAVERVSPHGSIDCDFEAIAVAYP